MNIPTIKHQKATGFLTNDQPTKASNFQKGSYMILMSSLYRKKATSSIVPLQFYCLSNFSRVWKEILIFVEVYRFE